MSRYLTVKNWEEFQHYKDRCPPWIKLHRSLLDDYDFSRLHDASKAHLLMIWLLASQQNGRVPNDPIFLRNKLGLEKAPDLEMLINQGFLCVEQDAINPLAEGKQNARLEEKRRGEKMAHKTTLPKDFQISERVISWANEKGHHSLQAHFENFVSAAKAKGYTYADWDEALMKAIRDNWAKVPPKAEQRRVAL